MPGEVVAGHRDEVAEHRARGRRAARAAAVEHQLPGRLGLDEHRVEGVADAGQRVAGGDHRRVHAHADRRLPGAVDRPAGDAEQLDRAAHLLGAGHVAGGHRGDPLPVDVGGADPGVERERGQDRRLRRRVEAFDVGGRVGLGVAQRGRLFQRLLEAGSGGVHRREDEVGGAVDDAGDPGDRVALQRLAQRPQQRDRTGDGRPRSRGRRRPRWPRRAACRRLRRAAPCWR